MTTSEWLTWNEAAELVGCPIATIDWHKRQGRIKSRGRRAGSLERASVEEFAEWWHARQQARATSHERPHTSRREPPEPAGWLSSVAAAEVAGVSPTHLAYLVKNERLSATMRGGRLWVRESDARAYAVEAARWITMQTAASIVGLSASTIWELARSGVIEKRSAATRVPSLARASVEEYAARHRQAVARRRQKEAQHTPVATGPPEDGQVWLDVTTTALVLGLSAGRVRQLAQRGSLPFTEHGSRRWFVRSHVEQVAAARAFATRMH